MQPDLDWVGRDLQRLANEGKLARPPTAEEWQRIWAAATDWADAFGVVTANARIDDFVRQFAPGALRETAPPASIAPDGAAVAGAAT